MEEKRGREDLDPASLLLWQLGGQVPRERLLGLGLGMTGQLKRRFVKFGVEDACPLLDGE